MSITHSKPQQQTLSIRVSEWQREFLELSRQVIANRHGDAVSISDVARILLESAKEDRLDFRLEVAELQQSPTSALPQVRRKREQQQLLSWAEWVFLAQYVQVACEELSGTTRPPSPDSFVALLEALLAVRSLRTDRGRSGPILPGQPPSQNSGGRRKWHCYSRAWFASSNPSRCERRQMPHHH